MESKASSTSNLVIHRPEALLSCSERASAAVSSQPVRRGRRVTDPNSWPVRARAAPACAQRAGLLASYNSLGKGPLPTRVQYALATRAVFRIQAGGNIGHQRRELIGIGERRIQRARFVHRRGIQITAQYEIVEIQIFAQPRFEMRCIEYILNAQSAARGFILIGRANAAASGTDSFIVCARFARLVKRNVIRQYQRCRAGDE